MNEYNPFQTLTIEHKKSHADYLADQIIKMIADGQLQAGKAFPNEMVLCKQLNVSRGTLREAYKILEIQGFITRSKHGTFVKERDNLAIDGSFSASLELSQYNDLIEFVSLLESEAVFLAAQRATEEQIAEMEKYAQLCDENRYIPGAIEEYNYQLHLQIRMASGNEVLISALSATYETFNQKIIKKLYTSNDFLDNSIKEHENLMQAIREHDPEKAKKYAYEHLMSDVEQFRKL